MCLASVSFHYAQQLVTGNLGFKYMYRYGTEQVHTLVRPSPDVKP